MGMAIGIPGLKTLYIMEILLQRTDEQHALNTSQILDILEHEYGVKASRQTIYSEIDKLEKSDLDIVKLDGKLGGYYIGSRQFELPELKLMVDAVQSSRFITKKKSNALGKKLAQLASENQRKELRRNIQATNRVKSENESIYYSVNTVNEAISRRKKIRFQYTEFGPDLKEVLRGDGEIYELSPYALLWNEDYYYVVGWSDKHGNVSVFRVDRLYRPEILEEKAVKRPEDFKLDDYSMPIFDMFEGPERVPVKLEVKNELAKYIVDRFGTKLETKQISDDRFSVEVEVSLSPTFYAWVFQFAGGMRILKPKKAVDEFLKMVNLFVEKEAL